MLCIIYRKLYVETQCKGIEFLSHREKSVRGSGYLSWSPQLISSLEQVLIALPSYYL